MTGDKEILSVPVPAGSERIVFHEPSTSGEVSSTGVFTLVLWLFCLVVGVLGLSLPYTRPRPLRPEEPIVVEQLQVELTPAEIPPDAAMPPPDPLAPPPPPDALKPPAITQPIAVAQPGPAITFALPVEGPTRIVEAKRAEYSRPQTTNAPTPALTPPTPQRIIYGQGEGKQPELPYPVAAQRLGQEGTVVVRLTVGENGRVLTAEAQASSPWPLLNEAAIRGVRERWRFSSGPMRIYEVSIRYQLPK